MATATGSLPKRQPGTMLRLCARSTGGGPISPPFTTKEKTTCWPTMSSIRRKTLDPSGSDSRTLRIIASGNGRISPQPNSPLGRKGSLTRQVNRSTVWCWKDQGLTNGMIIPVTGHSRSSVRKNPVEGSMMHLGQLQHPGSELGPSGTAGCKVPAAEHRCVTLPPSSPPPPSRHLHARLGSATPAP